jgi:hypothetical protein
MFFAIANFQAAGLRAYKRLCLSQNARAPPRVAKTRRGAATAEREVILDVMNNGFATTSFTSILATLMTGSG